MSDRETRMRGRELALAVLCHLESYPPAEHPQAIALVLDSPPSGDAEGEDAIAALAAEPSVRAFASELVAAWTSRRAEVDELIDATSNSWRLARMDRVDRNVLRIATAELIGRAETPRAAIIAEAVRLASRYGSDRSAPFVNGLVEALARRARPVAPEAG
jgi:transcription antitermination protein NusB